MTATHYRLEQGSVAALAGGRADEFAGARRRLTLAVLWFVGLIAWGLFSYLIQPASEPQSALRAEQGLDGHGKWTGQTSDWRHRSQIPPDAGTVGRD